MKNLTYFAIFLLMIAPVAFAHAAEIPTKMDTNSNSPPTVVAGIGLAIAAIILVIIGGIIIGSLTCNIPTSAPPNTNLGFQKCIEKCTNSGMDYDECIDPCTR